MSTRRRMIRSVLWTTAALVGATPAQAGSAPSDAVTVLLGPVDHESGTSEMVLRVRGELVADGFPVESVRLLPGPDRADLVHEQCARSRGSIAAGLFLNERADDIEMIFCDPAAQRQVVRHAHRPLSTASDPPEVIARHMVDVLRAGLLDFAVESLRIAERPKIETRIASATPPVEEQPRTIRGAFELGGVGLVSFGGLQASVAPLVRLRIALSPWFQLRLTGTGGGTTPTVDSENGSATISQALGLAEAFFVLAPSTWLRPVIVVGGGVYTAGVSGSGRPPYGGTTSEGVAFAFDGGVGISPWITSSLSMALEAHVVCAVPAMAVRFVDRDAVRLGQPMLLFSLSIAEWI